MRRREREEAARKAFGEILRKGFQPSELYMINIIQQEIAGDDPRLSTYYLDDAMGVLGAAEQARWFAVGDPFVVAGQSGWELAERVHRELSGRAPPWNGRLLCGFAAESSGTGLGCAVDCDERGVL